MEVDWITVAAQIVNFLVLVWLLKRFLYGPVIRAMDKREARIAGKLQEAQEAKRVVEAEVTRYREMQDSFEKQRQERLAVVQADVDSFGRSLQATAREEMSARRAEWLQNLSDEKVAFLNDMRARSVDAFSSMARRALGDLANQALEDQIARRFVAEMGDLDERALTKLRLACEREGRAVVLRTAFGLSAERRREVSGTLRAALGEDVEIAFERSSDLICGIELRAGGQLVRWSLDSFLDEFETELSEAIERRAPESA
ncbi:MAG: hypothetical protein GY798_34535 [Hyphomicrobiales bacterium]|nr:hypothetical protein [Hyphomicrobiales bacterium]